MVGLDYHCALEALTHQCHGVMNLHVGLPIHHLALLWCNANPNVSTVILGASKLSQLKDNLEALKHKDKVTPEVLAEIEKIMGNKPAVPQRF